MKVSELGEFGLIQRLASILGDSGGAQTLVGIGDDAAVWRSGDSVLLATTDTMVSGVHFLPEWRAWQDIGWKALASNVSDIAAMGGTPEAALVTLALPQGQAVADIDALYRGLRECAQAYNVSVLGGDVISASQLVITVAVIGRAQVDAAGDPLLLRRDAARPGEAIAVTGTLGDSAAGLALLKQGKAADAPLARAHLRPKPPLALATAAALAGVRCGIDISDGLAQDLGHICRQSGVGAELRAEAIPLSVELRQYFPLEAQAMACGGGEDYQLLLVARENVLAEVQQKTGETLTIIGRIVDDSRHAVRLFDESGGELTLPSAGWEHLR